jgi:hypothetical protein
MSCGGGHLGFPIGIKNSNLVKDIPMIIHFAVWVQVYWWRKLEESEKTNDLSGANDKLYHIMLYASA